MTSPEDRPRPRVGVGCIVVSDDGKVLLIRRSRSHGAGTWSTPGGYLEFGERLADCAAREASEETGVFVSTPEFYAVTNDIFDDTKHFVTVWMLARAVGGRAAPSEEASEVGWFSPGALPHPRFLSLENLIERSGLPPSASG